MAVGGYQIIDVGVMELTPSLPSSKIDGIYEAIEGATKPILICGEITTTTGVIVILPMWASGVHEGGQFIIPLKNPYPSNESYNLIITEDDTIIFNVETPI